MRNLALALLSALLLTSGCNSPSIPASGNVDAGTTTPVGDTPTRARSPDGNYISWREHLIDSTESAGFLLSGSDGLVMADVDGDGFEDIVSVHESDTIYDGQADGHVRIAFGSSDPHTWTNVTLSEGPEAGAPEDASIGDVDGDGFLDVIVASELAHLVYFQNPGRNIRKTGDWPRLILPMTKDRGSFIRVFLGDFNGDGRLEAVAPNKGAQNPGADRRDQKTAISIFHHSGDPLDPDAWEEVVLGEYAVPQNSHTIDIDGDGDTDIIGGVRFERRLVIFENRGNGFDMAEHEVRIDDGQAAGFNLDFADVNRDGRLDIIGATSEGLAWLEQPASLDGTWQLHPIGTFFPDTMTGITVADINGNGRVDVIGGSYSRGPRSRDGDVGPEDRLGRIGWFEQPADLDEPWTRHDISRRKRGMFDKFVGRDMDGDGDIDFVGTRGNSNPYDGVFWLEQVRTDAPVKSFERARHDDSEEMRLPAGDQLEGL